MTSDEHSRVVGKLHDMLTSVCEYAHERVAQLLSAPSHAQASEQREKNSSSQIQARTGDKQVQNQNNVVCIIKHYW